MLLKKGLEIYSRVYTEYVVFDIIFLISYVAVACFKIKHYKTLLLLHCELYGFKKQEIKFSGFSSFIYTIALCENLSQIASSFHTLNIWQCVGDPVFEILYHPGKMVLAAFQTMISAHHEHQKTKECPSWNVRMRCHLCLII